MTDELQSAIVAYHGIAVASLGAKVRTKAAIRNLELIVNPRLELLSQVETLEAHELFGMLIRRTKAAFQGDDFDFIGWWDHQVKNFFRRSGFYSGAYKGEALESKELVRAYLNAFKRREIERTYPAPIEYVSFDTDKLEFASFEIRRFSAAEIDSMFQNDINRVFFERAVADARLLDDHWLLRVVERIPVIDPLSTPLPGPEVMLQYTPFPAAFETVLQQLALYDWRCWDLELYSDDEPGKGWLQPKVPFVLVLDDDVLSIPRSIPDLSCLETEPDTIHIDGDEIDIDRPARGMEMTAEDEASFKEFMIGIGPLLETVRRNSSTWTFLELALQFFVKAFLTEGPEQLLWHVTTLEALFGQKGSGVTKRLAGRIGAVLGRDGDEEDSVAKRFEDLYRFRCDLVHGNPPKSMFRRHLREARELARRTSLWFLHYANHFLGELADGDLPTREEMLRALDLAIDGSARLNRLISRLPADFPKILEWTDS